MLFLIGLWVLAFAAVAKPIQSGEYVISIRPGQPTILRIKASIPISDGRLSMHPNGAEQFPKRWAEFVKALTVTDDAGRAVTISELPDAQWSVDVKPDSRIRLNYEVHLDHEKHKWAGGIDGVAFVRDGSTFATGRTYLITSGDPKNIRVTFDLPDDWRVSASWKPAGRSGKRFTARNLTDLRESMFLAGDHEALSFKRSGFELTFALGGGGLRAKKAEFESLAGGVLDYYIKLMGGIPKPPPANKFERVIVIINPGKDVDGEVIGNHISMILDPKADPQSQVIGKFIFAHEFFHLWNGKSINVADTTEDWFKEGVTSYYTLKALLATGAVTEQQVFGTLSGLFYQRYAVDPGLGKSSMRDVASGMSKDKHWGLIYGGGLFAGICQDIRIRNATRNKKSLDDLMRDYYKRLAGSDRTYTTADLQESMSELSGEDQSEFFKRYVFGTERVPIETCLNEAGLTSSVENNALQIGRKPNASALESAILVGVLGK